MYKRKDGRYRERITLPDGKTKEFFGHTKKEVINKIAEWTAEQEHGRPFQAVADEWWTATIDTLAYNTRKPYQPAIRRACEVLGARPIKDIKPPEIAAHIERMSETYANKTIKTQLLIYNQIFAFAVAHGYADFNPARDLKATKGTPRRKVTMPTAADLAAVKASVDLPFGLFAYMALYTGLRRGELLALEWKDVDRITGTITVSKSLYHDANRPRVKSPKTEASTATVPILDALAAVLPNRKRGLVFPNDSGSYMTETQFQRAWQIYTEVSGVTATPHQFRHAFATMIFEAGIPAEQAQALLRHAQYSTTKDVYTDIRQQRQVDLFSAVRGADIS